jgi:hypothetical protein
MSMRVALCLALCCLIFSAPAAPAAEKDFSGRWAIFAVTDSGQCLRGFRLAVRVNKGKAYLVGHSSKGATSSISSRGDVSIRYVKGHDLITVIGRLKGTYGSGAWAFPNYRCVGRWRAERQ